MKLEDSRQKTNPSTPNCSFQKSLFVCLLSLILWQNSMCTQIGSARLSHQHSHGQNQTNKHIFAEIPHPHRNQKLIKQPVCETTAKPFLHSQAKCSLWSLITPPVHALWKTVSFWASGQWLPHGSFRAEGGVGLEVGKETEVSITAHFTII